MEKNAHGQLIFNKDKSVKWGKDNVFNKLCWNNWIAICKKFNFNHVISYAVTNSKLIVDLNVKAKSIQPLKENIEENLVDFRLGKDFFKRTRRHRKEKEIHLKTSSKLKTFVF